MELKYIRSLGEKKLWENDNTFGLVELLDFSRANENEESRKETVCYVAGLCYGSEPKDLDKLYNRLKTESAGGPSSAMEFVREFTNPTIGRSFRNNPVMLTGYGGFNISRTPQFSTSYIVWLEAGGMIAIPNLRGGGEYGETWHEAGMKENKQNVFDDFIAAAEWLIDNKYTNPEKIAISGGSNGGLLVGAVTVQRPELFSVVNCSVPLLDMLRYHKFGPARYWISEYGSADNPEQFEYLYEYSPYHNIIEGTDYPAILFSASGNDARV